MTGAKAAAKPRKKTRRAGLRARIGRWKAKRPSLAMLAAGGGLLVAGTGIGAAQVSAIEDKIAEFQRDNPWLAEIGLVTGVSFVAAIIILKLASSLAPDMIGRPWRAFLGGMGMRP